MSIPKQAIKEASEVATVFLFSAFIVGSSFMRRLALGGRDYTMQDLIVALILALILTAAYVLFKRKYIRDSKLK